MSNTNLYGKGARYMIDSGTFWRCRHGFTQHSHCVRCGIFHPIKFIRRWWSSMK